MLVKSNKSSAKASTRSRFNPFTRDKSSIEGADVGVITQETITRHTHAFPDRPAKGATLDVGGDYQWRKDGEEHLFSTKDSNRCGVNSLGEMWIASCFNCAFISSGLFRMIFAD